jgi:hypothetical protein
MGQSSTSLQPLSWAERQGLELSEDEVLAMEMMRCALEGDTRGVNRLLTKGVSVNVQHPNKVIDVLTGPALREIELLFSSNLNLSC